MFIRIGAYNAYRIGGHYRVQVIANQLAKIFAGGGFSLLQSILHAHNSHKGGILIEFAFSIPVCIALLFFVHDHFRFYELKNKLKTSTYLIASMIQNINNSKTDKKLRPADMKRILFAGSLNLFHTNSMFYPYPLGVIPYLSMVYVERVESNKYFYHSYWFSADDTSSSPNTITAHGGNAYRNLSQVIAIHPDLECYKDGDERLLIRYHLQAMCGDESSSKLGLLIMKLNSLSVITKKGFCQAIVITPKPGLFPLKW